jgi:hypothetical protein
MTRARHTLRHTATCCSKLLSVMRRPICLLAGIIFARAGGMANQITWSAPQNRIPSERHLPCGLTALMR